LSQTKKRPKFDWIKLAKDKRIIPPGTISKSSIQFYRPVFTRDAASGGIYKMQMDPVNGQSMNRLDNRNLHSTKMYLSIWERLSIKVDTACRLLFCSCCYDIVFIERWPFSPLVFAKSHQ
jgi:hypothetical protein